jgi:hypothetical protein
MFMFDTNETLNNENNARFAAALVQMGVRSVCISPTQEQLPASQPALADFFVEDTIEECFAQSA